MVDESLVDKDKAGLYYSVFSSPNGRAVLADLVKFSGFYADSWDESSNVQSYRAGQRRMVLRILGFVGLSDPEKSVELQDSLKKDDS